MTELPKRRRGEVLTGWWESLTPEQKAIALDMQPEVSGNPYRALRVRTTARDAGRQRIHIRFRQEAFTGCGLYRVDETEAVEPRTMVTCAACRTAEFAWIDD